MKVFISWSCEPSRAVARGLAAWLRETIQEVEPWMSEENIGSGKRWRDEVGAALDETDFGLICLTPFNQRSRWLHFEAGALAKHLDVARVIPICIDMETTDISGPLADWQARKLDRDGMERIVSDINAVTQRPLLPDGLKRVFDRNWPDLERTLEPARRALPKDRPAERPTRELLDELLERVRRIERDSIAVEVAKRDVPARDRSDSNVYPGMSLGGPADDPSKYAIGAPIWPRPSRAADD